MDCRTVVTNAEPNPDANTAMPKRSIHCDTLRQCTRDPKCPRRNTKERVRTLERLFELFSGYDAAAEIRQLKEQDGGF